MARPKLADIGERAERATEGPWFREYGDVITATDDPRDVADGYLVENLDREDAETHGADEDRYGTGLGTWPARVMTRSATPWRAADEGGERG